MATCSLWFVPTLRFFWLPVLLLVASAVWDSLAPARVEEETFHCSNEADDPLAARGPLGAPEEGTARSKCWCVHRVDEPRAPTFGPTFAYECDRAPAALREAVAPVEGTASTLTDGRGGPTVPLEVALAEVEACARAAGRCRVFFVLQRATPNPWNMARLAFLVATVILVVMLLPTRVVRVRVDAARDAVWVDDLSIVRRARRDEHALSDIRAVLDVGGDITFRRHDGADVVLVADDVRPERLKQRTLVRLRAILEAAALTR